MTKAMAVTVNHKHIMLLFFTGCLLLAGCDSAAERAEAKQQAQELVKRSVDNMIPVKGGEFLMGDFGTLAGEKVPYAPDIDNMVHKVTLSDFKMAKYKVSYYDYNLYAKATNKDNLKSDSAFYNTYPKLKKDDIPAAVTWQQAKDYCLWLGRQSGQKFDLPTEAQWEYAARSGGKFILFSTNNGKYEPGVNVPDNKQINKMMGGPYWWIYPIGKYPPTPLGLYDMGFNGPDWINDWYSEDYYKESDGMKDPPGPESGDKKVIRGLIRIDPDEYDTALTMYRSLSDMKPRNGTYGFRCVIND